MNQNKSSINSIDCLAVLKHGNSILRKKVSIIEDFTIIPDMVKQMHMTMQVERGLGLAANQVGWSVNLMVIDTRNYDDNDEGESYTFINSQIIYSEGEVIMEEGCLSIPDIRAQITRPETIILKYQDVEKKVHERKFSGLIARVIQHEMDHLNGKLFIDYLSQTKRMLINKRLIEISKTGKASSGITL